MNTAQIQKNGKTNAIPERLAVLPARGNTLVPPSKGLDSPTQFVRKGKRMNWDELYAKRTRRMKRSAIRELLKVTRRPEVISFAGGLPAAELFPIPQVKAAVDAVLQRLGGKCLQYGETEGVPELREWVAHHFSRCRRGGHTSENFSQCPRMNMEGRWMRCRNFWRSGRS